MKRKIDAEKGHRQNQKKRHVCLGKSICWPGRGKGNFRRPAPQAGCGGSTKSSKSSRWASKDVFVEIWFDEVLKKMYFCVLLGRRTVSQQSQKSKMLADSLIPMGSFGAGRRERRGAGEEKEEGLLRTVDCTSNS